MTGRGSFSSRAHSLSDGSPVALRPADSAARSARQAGAARQAVSRAVSSFPNKVERMKRLVGSVAKLVVEDGLASPRGSHWEPVKGRHFNQPPSTGAPRLAMRNGGHRWSLVAHEVARKGAHRGA